MIIEDAELQAITDPQGRFHFDAVPVGAHEQLTLRTRFAPGSAEAYAVFDGDPATTPARGLTEVLSVSWFATAGSFGCASSGTDVPDTIFHRDTSRNGPTLHLPESGGIIDLWAVARDERGGTDFLHRRLQLE